MSAASGQSEAQPMRVLVADDDPVSRRLLEVALTQAGYPVVIVSNGTAALEMLERFDGPRLAVLDWMMPELDGVEVCRAVRKKVDERYIYTILLTAKGHQAEIVEGLEAGADDYITKPYDLPELKARLRAGKRILELQEQLVVARESLRVQAMHDSLTKLYNRMAILDMLDREMSRFVRDGAPLSLIMVDLDHFKPINDTHGHPVGDAVLREVARRMQKVIRSADAVGRYGGEEFLVVSPGSNLAGVQKQAERIRQSVAEEPVRAGDLLLPVTVSLGVAQAFPGLERPAELLRTADNALYTAKKEGRNRVVLASDVKLAGVR